MKIERDGESGIAVVLDDLSRHVVPGAAVRPYEDANRNDGSGDRAYWSEVELRRLGEALVLRTGGVTDHEGGTDTWQNEKAFQSSDAGRTWTGLARPPAFGDDAPLARLSTHGDTLERLARWRVIRRARRTILGDHLEAFADGTNVVHLLVLDRVGGDTPARARLEVAAQKLLSVRHLNVAAVTAFEHDPGRPPILEMEELRGETLDEREREDRGKPMDPLSARTFVLQMLAGLEALHAAGIAHGFVRPESIALARRPRPPGGLEAKLVAAGLLLAAEDPGGTRGSLRMPNDLGYVPLEAMWPPSRYTPTADVFGIGAILYELLSGRRAFPGANVPEIMGAMMRGPEPLALQRHAALGRVAMRAIAKDSRERFTTPAAMREAIEATIRR